MLTILYRIIIGNDISWYSKFVMKYKCMYDILSLNHCNDKSNCTISRRIQRNLNKMQISQSEEANKRMRIPNSKLLLFSHSSISFDIKHITTYV